MDERAPCGVRNLKEFDREGFDEVDVGVDACSRRVRESCVGTSYMTWRSNLHTTNNPFATSSSAV
jgi:hypothetical protein